jgi:two-component system cell cycle sensor histidine kinase/response regulator CckA
MSAKRLLKDKDRKFQLLFEEHPQPMWVFDPETQEVLEANEAAAALYGWSRDEFRGMNLAVVQEGPVRHRTKSGRIIDIEKTVHEIQYRGEKAELVVLMDVTGHRQLEDQLRQAQKMEAVGMLAGGVAHDFNNLLTIITGYSQLILNNLSPTDPNHHSAEQILKAGERAAALTKQLLAFSRRQVLQPKLLDLNMLVTSLGAMLRRLIGEHIDLRLALGSDLGQVSADPGQIDQVLMNLVVNARDAMPNGGTLTIETANVELDENYVGHHIAVKPGPFVMLAVSDNGTGMDESTKAHLFEPFFTTKAPGQGTGLGLSTVFGIVKQSHGSVQVYSEPRTGTSVKVYLPRTDLPVAIESKEARQKVARGRETILVAEDEEMVRHLVREALERAGYKVLDAADPTEALRKAERYRGAIHLLITDVVMPKVSGRELAEQLMQRRPELKVLYISGYTDNAIISNEILRKEVAFLQKPFTPTALTDKVREVLGGNGKTKHALE